MTTWTTTLSFRLSLAIFVVLVFAGCQGDKSVSAVSSAGAEPTLNESTTGSDYVSDPSETESETPSNDSSERGEDTSGDRSDGYDIVYTRVPRADKILHFKASDPLPPNVNVGDPFDPSFMDKLPEVSHIFGGFNAPGQLVWHHRDGTETVIFDCVNGMPAEGVVPPQQNGDDVCVPMDPAVSFDGTRVAFSVYHGKAEKKRELKNYLSGEVWRMTSPSWAGIYIYNFESGTLTHWPHEKGIWDTAPVWIPGGKMMFTSTREGVYQRHTSPSPQPGKHILQLWEANRDGSDMHNVGNQSQGMVLHPIVHSSGRVLYSIHEVPFARYWDTRGNPAGAETLQNVWWIDSVDLRGGDLNGHMKTHDLYESHYRNGRNGDTFKRTTTALHFLGELSNGDVCSDMYYRKNDLGAGAIMCWPAEGTDLSPLGHEGSYPFTTPNGAYEAVYGQSNDYYGPRVRDPAGAPDGQILYSGALDVCHAGSKDGGIAHQVRLTRERLNNQPGGTCDFGVYIQPPQTNGRDKGHDTATEIINSPHWHEIMPKLVVPYSDIYGISEPKQPPLSNTGDTDDSYGVFASVNVYKGNLLSAYGWNGPSDGRWCHFQGCALQSPLFIGHQEGSDYDRVNPDKMKYIRFWRVEPLKHPRALGVKGFKPIAELWGQPVELMGDVPIQDDGSFKAKLPANVPFLMAGVDEQGRAIARHQHVMALRPGEKQVCSGCHLHATTDAENDKYPFNATLAAQASQSAASPEIRWPNEKSRPEWRDDIYQMLNKNCKSCHGGEKGNHAPNFAQDPAKLYLELTNYNANRQNWPKSLFPPGHAKTENGERAAVPWLTRYINGLFSRESLLYWKAAGKRMDGRTDTARNDDFNFGPAHKSFLTKSQLRMLSDWIEGGLYCDTSKGKCGVY